MSMFVDETPPRLKQRSDQANVIERIAGQALRDLPSPKPLSALALARIADDIEKRAPVASVPRRTFWIVVTAALLLGVGTAASAQHLGVIRRWLDAKVSPGEPAVPREARPRAGWRSSGGRTERPAITPGSEESSPAPATTPPAEKPAAEINQPDQTAGPRMAGEQPKQPSRPESIPPTSSRSQRLALRPSPDPIGRPTYAPAAPVRMAYLQNPTPLAAESPPSSVLATAPTSAPPSEVPSPHAVAPEPTPLGLPTSATSVPTTAASEGPAPQATRHLTEAVRALRVARSPETALALLDRHARELEGNALAREALLVRVEAMLTLERKDDVLRLLDRTSLTAGAASRSLLLMRGQLRAASNRCADAIGDFSLVLADAQRPPKQALWGRAMCHERMGDTARAKADLDRYRREFSDDHDVELPRR